jgi:DNA-binding NarL/FixJ family response regulator
MPLGGGALSGVGSTLFLRGHDMDRDSVPIFARSAPSLFTEGEWTIVVKSMRFSPRQSEVVKLVLQGMRDKQVALALGLRVTTVRMHLRHIFARLNVADRMELALRIFAVIRDHDRRRHSPK